MKRFAFITTCMGRLEHVKKTSAILMADPAIDGKEVSWVFVDYDCPENSGEWVKAQYGDRVTVVDAKATHLTEDDKPIFNKPVALNSGAMEAIENGADYLIFIDADTIVSKGLLQAVRDAASPDRFLIMTPAFQKRDLTGFLVLHKMHFLKLNGYDPRFMGWGAEDLDIRVRLFLKLGLKFDELSPELADSVPHEDEMRVQHYADKDKDRSHHHNLNLLCENVYKYTNGRHILEFYDIVPTGALLRRLLGVDLAVSPGTIK